MELEGSRQCFSAEFGGLQTYEVGENTLVLTDIFAYRYQDRPIWAAFTEVEQRLLNQGFKIVKDMIPYYGTDGKVIETAKIKWRSLHDQLARELGVNELSQSYYSYTTKWQGADHTHSGSWSIDHVCEQFVLAAPVGGVDPDRFITERLSFIELAVRMRGYDVA